MTVTMQRMNEEITAAVREALAERNMTQTALAKQVGLEPNYLTSMLQGRRGKVPETWQKILEALDLKLLAAPRSQDVVIVPTGKKAVIVPSNATVRVEYEATE